VGAGCSRSAGIQLASEIARDLVVELADRLGGPAFSDPDQARTWLVDREDISKQSDWGRLYSEIFDKLVISKRQQRDIIQKVIESAGNQINWAHICLGELVSKCYVHTVLTTNFDQLVARGIILAGLLPVVADGVEAMSRLEPIPRYPQVVHLHGSMHTYNPRNGNDDVEETRDLLPMQGTLWNVCLGADLLVVVGYAGKEEGVVEILQTASASIPNLVIFWVMYESDPSELSPKVVELLRGPNKFVIPNQDADAFFGELMYHLKEPIDWMQQPLKTLSDLSVVYSDPAKWTSETIRRDIRTSLDFYKRKLGAMKEAQALSPEETRIDRAAEASRSGNDALVVELLSDVPTADDPLIAPLLAQSLIRIGDSARDESKLGQSVALLNAHLAETPGDFSAEIALGDAHIALADIVEDYPERQDDAATHRELAVSAYCDAIAHVPPGNLATWRSAREKFATAVWETGNQGGPTENIDRAIEVLDELVHHPDDLNMSRLELAEILDRVAMLRLMRGERTGNHEDLLEARSNSQDALDMVAEDLSSTTAIGILRDHASAYRAFGRQLIREGQSVEGRVQLSKAADLYRAAGEAYLAGVSDADEGDSRKAAKDAFDEAAKLFHEIGSGEVADQIITLFDSIKR